MSLDDLVSCIYQVLCQVKLVNRWKKTMAAGGYRYEPICHSCNGHLFGQMLKMGWACWVGWHDYQGGCCVFWLEHIGKRLQHVSGDSMFSVMTLTQLYQDVHYWSNDSLICMYLQKMIHFKLPVSGIQIYCLCCGDVWDCHTHNYLLEKRTMYRKSLYKAYFHPYPGPAISLKCRPSLASLTAILSSVVNQHYENLPF